MITVPIFLIPLDSLLTALVANQVPALSAIEG